MTADDTRARTTRRGHRAQQRDRRRRKANEVRRKLRHQGDDREALVPEEVSRRESATLDGAQAGEKALHADRCVEQYGLSCASNGSRGVWRWGTMEPFAGRGIELGSLYAAVPVSAGLRHRSER
jgi:hypothetical protein